MKLININYKYLIFVLVIAFVISKYYFGTKVTSEIFQSFGIGFGSFFGGLGGLTAFSDWRDKKRRGIDYINKLQDKYPRKYLNHKLSIVQKESTIGWLFLLDKETKIKYWIKDPQALTDLGYSYADVTTIPDKEFDNYSQGDPIRSIKDFN